MFSHAQQLVAFRSSVYICKIAQAPGPVCLFIACMSGANLFSQDTRLESRSKRFFGLRFTAQVRHPQSHNYTIVSFKQAQSHNYNPSTSCAVFHLLSGIHQSITYIIAYIRLELGSFVARTN